jgi:hypothetical protein
VVATDFERANLDLFQTITQNDRTTAILPLPTAWCDLKKGKTLEGHEFIVATQVSW